MVAKDCFQMPSGWWVRLRTPWLKRASLRIIHSVQHMYTTVPIIAAYYLLSRPNWICTDHNNKNYLLSNNFACFQKSHEFQKDYLRCMFCYFSITEKNPPTLHKQAFPQAPKVIRICNCQGHKYRPGKAKSMNSVHFNFFFAIFRQICYYFCQIWILEHTNKK